jgi:aspartate racemase
MAAPLTIGILGGMGPAATLDLMAAILRLSQGLREQDGIRVIADSHPGVPDRNEAILRGGPSPAPVLAEMAQGLERAGADLLAMACNTAHAFQFDIERAVGVPFVSMIEEASAAAAHAAPPGGVIGLLAADGCLAAGLYQTELARRGCACVVLAPDRQAQFMRLLYAIKAGDLGARVRTDMQALAVDLQAQGASTLIAACTEVPLVLQPETIDLPLVNATEALAAALLAYARGDRAPPAPFRWTEVGPA